MNIIKYLIMDVDGTLTDGKIYMGNDGELFKVFDIKDGYGIHDLLIPSNIIPIIVTGRESRILHNRCKELGILHCYQNVKDKLSFIREYITNTGDHFSNIAYIGDDLNDLESMKEIKLHGGLIGCPADASKQVKDISHFISSVEGGKGAVREFIEYIISSTPDF